MTLYKRLLLALALLTLIAPAANARFKKARISRNMSCKNNTAKATLDFEAGAPNGDYSAKLTAETESTDLTVEGLYLQTVLLKDLKFLKQILMEWFSI